MGTSGRRRRIVAHRVEPALPGKHHVAEHEAALVQRRVRERGLRVGDRRDLAALVAEDQPDRVRHDRLVVHDQHVAAVRS